MENTLNTATIIHRLPGRIRLKITSLLDQTLTLSTLDKQVSELQGVINATTNELTKTMLIIYDVNQTDEGTFIHDLQSNNILSVSAADEEELVKQHHPKHRVKRQNAENMSEQLHQLIKKTLNGINNRVQRLTNDTLDLTILIPFALFLLAIRDILIRRSFNVPWYNLIWYGIGLYRYMHKDSNSLPSLPTSLADEDLESAGSEG